MKFTKATSLVIMILLSLYTYGTINAQTIKRLSPEALNKDFKFLVSSIEEAHPNPYTIISKSDFKEAIQKIEAKLNDTLTLKEYYRLIAPLVASIQDGHTALSFPGKALTMPGDNLFPFAVKCTLEKPYLTISEHLNDAYSQIPIGAKIISINNIPSENIISKIIENTSGENKAYRLKMTADFNFFGSILNTFYDFTGNYLVKYSFENKIYNTEIAPIVFTDFIKIVMAKQNKPGNKVITSSPDFTLLVKPEIKTAIIDFKYFGDKENFKVFLQESFKTLQEQKIENLIIDIRENGGGNSSLGNELLKYIAPVPFEQFAKTTIKYSRPQKEFYQQISKRDSTYLNMYHYLLEQQDGKTETVLNNQLISPNALENKFGGTTYLLTSIRTFSSAMNLAQAFKHYKIGKIIGEETGGQVVSFGDKIMVTLPASKFVLSVSTKRFYTIGATDKDTHGVLPDHKVKADDALNYVENLIKKKDVPASHL